MTKNQFVWVIVRCVGVYFAYLTVTSAAGFVGQLSLVAQSESASKQYLPVLLLSLIQVVMFAALAIYLIKDGSLMFDLLNREDPPSKIEEDIAESSLNL